MAQPPPTKKKAKKRKATEENKDQDRQPILGVQRITEKEKQQRIDKEAAKGTL